MILTILGCVALLIGLCAIWYSKSHIRSNEVNSFTITREELDRINKVRQGSPFSSATLHRFKDGKLGIETNCLPTDGYCGNKIPGNGATR